MRLIAFVLAASSLAACQTTNRCPPLVTYPAEFQRQAADELAAMPAGARVPVMIVDYGKLRDACRAAAKR